MAIRLSGLKSIYEEIADTYKNYILMGVLLEGEKLPSCRELAIELGINPNTVERAYAVLEQQGLVKTILKKGTFVAKAGQKNQEIITEAQKQIEGYKQAGITKQQLISIINNIYGQDLFDNK